MAIIFCKVTLPSFLQKLHCIRISTILHVEAHRTSFVVIRVLSSLLKRATLVTFSRQPTRAQSTPFQSAYNHFVPQNHLLVQHQPNLYKPVFHLAGGGHFRLARFNTQNHQTQTKRNHQHAVHTQPHHPRGHRLRCRHRKRRLPLQTH